MTPAKPIDCLDIAELEMELFPDNCLNETSIARELWVGFGYVIRDPAGLLVAYSLCRNTTDFVDLLRLGVRPSHQGRGLGRQLLEQVLSKKKPVMLTVKKKNSVALGMYLKRGFQICGELGTAWLMITSS